MAEASLPPVMSLPHHLANSVNSSDSPSTVNSAAQMDNSQNHQYECIPEYLLTMTRHHRPSTACHRQHQLYHRANTCSVPYATFSRSLLLSRGVPTASASDSSQCTCSPLPSATVVQEESSTPLLHSSVGRESHPTGDTSMIAEWKRRNSSTSTKRKSMGNEQRHSFLSQLRKSSVLQ